jgi:hypothetical protein
MDNEALIVERFVRFSVFLEPNKKYATMALIREFVQYIQKNDPELAKGVKNVIVLRGGSYAFIEYISKKHGKIKLAKGSCVCNGGSWEVDNAR